MSGESSASRIESTRDDADVRSLARLVSLEKECSALRVKLGLAPRITGGAALPDRAAFQLFDRYSKDFVCVTSGGMRARFASSACASVLGIPANEFVGRSQLERIHPDDLPRVVACIRDHETPGWTSTVEFRFCLDDGSYRWIECRAATVSSADRGRELLMVLRDATERHEAAERQARLAAELVSRLDQIRRLAGLMPICVSCKSIRDDDGYWQRLEVYLSDEASVEFTHGLCPDCATQFNAPHGR